MPSHDRFYRVVVDALAHDRLTLPTLPEVAHSIRCLVRNEAVSAARLAREILRDPAIAVRLIRVANSAAMRGGHRVDSVQQAVTRLGFEYTRMLVDGLALEQMFRARDRELHERLLLCWRDSVEVAALARALAEQCTLLQPEMAMLAGLVHRVGVLPIVKLAQVHAHTIDSDRALDETIDALAPRIGRMILQAWHFPTELVEVPALWPDLTRDHDGAADYADVVTVAVLRLRGAPDAYAPAYRKLDLEAGFALDESGPLAGSYRDCLQQLQAA
ncbi:HDOD domain-containing protein [Sinimarinibacterium thermocellulolyticum]|uniref:HDOD domain-containing protein n=1 Tax=Sinimarinibacterium thermocellulolyticum TaxID=3170016 RepID=A0ABV2A8M2_9GAMM